MKHSIQTLSLFGILLALALAVPACEEGISTEGIPYIERLVIQGTLLAGAPIDSIQITRTLPIGVPYSPEAAAITGATTTLTVDGTAYPLTDLGMGWFRPEGLVAESGKRYTLNVLWNGKHATASTTVPFQTPIDTVHIEKTVDMYDDTIYKARILATPIGEQVYALAYEMNFSTSGGQNYGYYDSYGLTGYGAVVRRRDTLATGQVEIQTNTDFGFLSSESQKITVRAFLHTFDTPFYDFYKLYYNDNVDNDGPFSTGSESIKWNIEGDGIGLFIGKAISEKTAVLE